MKKGKLDQDIAKEVALASFLWSCLWFVHEINAPRVELLKTFLPLEIVCLAISPDPTSSTVKSADITEIENTSCASSLSEKISKIYKVRG